MKIKLTSLIAVIFYLLAPVTVSFANDMISLEEIVIGKQRSEQHQARDLFRHPIQTLEFFGVEPNQTIIEIWPGQGWYSEIIAPYIKQSGGHFIAAGFPLNAGPKWRQKMQQAYIDKLARSPENFDQVKVIEIGPPTMWSLGEKESADVVLTFRNVHNWLKGGYEQHMFSAFFDVLKQGGVLGIVEHRANENTDIELMKKSGYMTEGLVIKLAQDAGFVLQEKSDINANPKDTKNHPKGVWTLPPTLRLENENKAYYLNIGESDRMTLKFIKP